MPEYFKKNNRLMLAGKISWNALNLYTFAIVVNLKILRIARAWIFNVEFWKIVCALIWVITNFLDSHCVISHVWITVDDAHTSTWTWTICSSCASIVAIGYFNSLILWAFELSKVPQGTFMAIYPSVIYNKEICYKILILIYIFSYIHIIIQIKDK